MGCAFWSDGYRDGLGLTTVGENVSPYYIVQRLATQIRIPLPKKTQVTDSKATKVSSE
jgi:hypothetical protein